MDKQARLELIRTRGKEFHIRRTRAILQGVVDGEPAEDANNSAGNRSPHMALPRIKQPNYRGRYDGAGGLDLTFEETYRVESGGVRAVRF